MPMFDERARDLARQDHVAAGETRAKLNSWEYLVYQADETAALNAKNALLEALEVQHTSARALVDRFDPRRRFLSRPRSKDEED